MVLVKIVLRIINRLKRQIENMDDPEPEEEEQEAEGEE